MKKLRFILLGQVPKPSLSMERGLQSAATAVAGASCPRLCPERLAPRLLRSDDELKYSNQGRPPRPVRVCARRGSRAACPDHRWPGHAARGLWCRSRISPLSQNHRTASSSNQNSTIINHQSKESPSHEPIPGKSLTPHLPFPSLFASRELVEWIVDC